MTRVRVATEPGYEVLIGSQILGRLGAVVRKETGAEYAALVCDDTVYARYGAQARSSLEDAGLCVHEFVFPHGERSKTLPVFGELLAFLAERGLTRSDCIVALGGGVTGDLAGFAAASYLRGVQWVNVPTTVLAAVDSSVGGKTGLDLPQGKNLVGAFWQPRAVLCDVALWDSLPVAVAAEGMAEALKYGVICDAKLFADVTQGLPREELVARCIQIKADLVARDERDRSVRALLNFGHTGGHAIERCSEYSISHGAAVAAGMLIAARAAERLGYAALPCTERVEKSLARFGLKGDCLFTPQMLTEAALHDKKRAFDAVTVILPRKLGECVPVRMQKEALEDFFRAGLER